MIMETTGRLKDIKKNVITNKYEVTFEVDDNIENAQELADQNKLLRIKATAFRQSRSLNANAMLWGLISIISDNTKQSKDNVYLELLRRYGKYEHVCVKEEAVASLKTIWRLVEELGPVRINNSTGICCLCFYGSSTYDTKEMSKLIEGTISEIKEMGLQNPYCSADMQQALAEWEANNG